MLVVILLLSGTFLGREQAEKLAGIVREYWHEPVLVRLHPEYIIGGELQMEAGFGPSTTP
jgi:hypothetical protein